MLRDHFSSRGPDGYERVKRKVCNGTRRPAVTGNYFWACDGGARLNICRTCRGKGYLLVEKESQDDGR